MYECLAGGAEPVKLTVHNLGRIKFGEIDIRPLTILVGPNNTNKTWCAYTLYGLACAIAGRDYSATTLSTQLSQSLNSNIERLVSRLVPILTDKTVGETRT